MKAPKGERPGRETGGRRSGRRTWWLVGGVVAVVAIAAAFAVGGSGPVDDRPQPVAGKPRLRLDLPALDGNGRVRIAEYRGTPVIVNFWAAWCTPCRRELPTLVGAAQDYEGRVQFLGVDHQDNREDATDLATSAGVTYPLGFDPKGATGAAIGIRGMPTTVFVDREGRVLERRTGEIDRKSLDATILRLYGIGPAGPADGP